MMSTTETATAAIHEIERKVTMNDREQRWIEQLNHRARQYQDAGMDKYGGVAQSAVPLPRLERTQEGPAD